jgi:tetratricopeptide (TPR) repeat protein
VLAIFWIALRGPWIAHVKAYYALPAIVPFGVIFALGWDWLQRKHPRLRSMLWVGLLVWAATVYASFWIRATNPQVQFLRGYYQGQRRDCAGAIELLSHALRLAGPNGFQDGSGPGAATLAENHLQLGLSLGQLGEWKEAQVHFAAAVELAPNDADLRRRLADFLEIAGMSGLATTQYEQIVKIEPDNAEASIHLAELLNQAGRGREAVAHYGKALEVEPDSAVVLNNLAWMLATSPVDAVRDGARAVRLAERACEVTAWQDPMLIGTLAAAYAEAGRFPEAVATAEKARDQARAQRQQSLVDRNEELLRLYRAGKPCRESQAH